MFWAGTGLHGWQLLLPMLIAGAGGGFFIAPATNVVLAGIRSGYAGSASGALATAQQVGPLWGSPSPALSSSASTRAPRQPLCCRNSATT